MKWERRGLTAIGKNGEKNKIRTLSTERCGGIDTLHMNKCAIVAIFIYSSVNIIF